MIEWMADLLVERTGESVEAWNRRVRETALDDEASVRAWLIERGVRDYPQDLLVYERFGYPDHLLAGPDELIEGQYVDRPALRPILDAILARLSAIGEVTVQARKGHVSLMTARRTFAAVQPTTKTRVDLGLRLEGIEPTARLQPAVSFGQSGVTIKVGLTSPNEVDNEVEAWLREAYQQSS